MGQRKEIGFCQACPQVLNLEYLSHIKSTFIECNLWPPPLSPLEGLCDCVECVSMKEVVGEKLGWFLHFTAFGAKGGCSHSSGDKGSLLKVRSHI